MNDSNEFAELLSEVFSKETPDNLKVHEDKPKDCPCKKNLAAFAKKLKSNVICKKFTKCRKD